MPMTAEQASTLLLLHFNSASPADFVDSSASGLKTTLRGTVAASTSAKFGGYCYEYSGAATSGSGVVLPQVPFNFRTNPYSLDMWAYPYSYPSTGKSFLFSSGYGDYFHRPSLSILGTGRLYVTQANGGNSPTFFQSVDPIPLNQWSHVVMSRNVYGCTTLFVNGVLVGSQSASAVVDMDAGFSPGAGLYSIGIGCEQYGTDNLFRGRIDELRLLGGMSVFDIPSFARPTAPHPDATPGDSLLLHCDGTNGGTSIVDSSVNVQVPTQIGGGGSVFTSTASARFGASSLRFGGSHAISYASSALFEAASRDWSIQCWVNIDSGVASGFRHIWQLFGASIQFRANLCYDAANSRFQFYTENGSGTGAAHIVGRALVPGVWTHTAVVKEGKAITLWVDGAAVGSTVTPAIPSGNLGLAIGTQNFSPNSTDGWLGYIDEFQAKMGTAIASVSFSPPTSPYPDSVLEAPSSIKPLVWAKAQVPGQFLTKVATAISPDTASSRGLRKDVYYGGGGMIVGFTKEQNVPSATVYAPRRLLLIRERGDVVVGETWSNGYTGAYAFMYVDMNAKYTIVAYDHTNTYGAEVATGVSPEPATFL